MQEGRISVMSSKTLIAGNRTLVLTATIFCHLTASLVAADISVTASSDSNAGSNSITGRSGAASYDDGPNGDRPNANRPNIVFILADDLGYGDLGCFGQKHFQTPHLDQMATEGMRLTSHYSGSTVCAPSRACLLTGQHTGHVFQRFNGSVEFRPDPQDACIARRLKDAGYSTGMIGKSGLSCNSENGALPNEKGFEHFFGYTSHRDAHRYYPQFLWRNGEKVLYDGNQGKQGVTYSGDEFLADTLKFLEENSQRPFFLHLSLQQPHADLNVTKRWRDKYLGKFEEQPYEGGHYRAEANPKATYAGMVSYLDDSVGQVLQKIRTLGIADNTLVIFSSDNGPMSEGGWNKNIFNSSGPLRGGKRDLYEGGIRVPTIAWWPGKIAPGSQSDHPSAFWDFAATACEVAGITAPEDTDGISYLPTLLGHSTQQQHDYLYWEFYERGGKQAARMGRWKGVRLKVSQDRNGPLELYDLSEDLSETQDVAAQHPNIIEKMEAILATAHVPSKHATFTKQRAMNKKQPKTKQ